MKKANVEQLIDMLSEYQYGELDDWGKMHLKDELTDLSEQLHSEDINEGHLYDGMMVLVENGTEIPKLYGEFTLNSMLTENPVKVKIKEITEVRQNKDGKLILEVLAKKIR